MIAERFQRARTTNLGLYYVCMLGLFVVCFAPDRFNLRPNDESLVLLQFALFSHLLTVGEVLHSNYKMQDITPPPPHTRKTPVCLTRTSRDSLTGLLISGEGWECPDRWRASSSS